MSSYLDDLTRNNDCPSDDALREVRGLLSEPWKQLGETNAEITRLETHLLELKQKRRKIEEEINRYSCILAPIRHVPPDILHTIFAHCLTTHRNPTMAASESPMLLTRVCSTWRSLAFSSPRLWAQIHIPFRKASAIFDAYPGHPHSTADKVSDILRLRCHAAREWLSRSGDCPLSISVSCPAHYADFDHQDPKPWGDETTAFLLETLMVFASRMRDLELNIPLELYCELETVLSALTLQNLVQLRASIYNRTSHILNEEPTLEVFKSPNLQRISIHPHLLSPGTLAKMFLPTQNITHFSNQAYCRPHGLVSLLKSLPHLIHCAFAVLTEESDEIHTETISLQNLNSLWIEEILLEATSMTNVYDCIHAPKLQWIEYHYGGSVRGPADHVPDGSASCILRLIERSPELSRLAINRLSFSPDKLAKIFHLDSLIILILNSTSVHIGGRIPESFDLRCLIATDRSLLPRLEVFELHATRESMNTVSQFIDGRIGVLKTMKVVFDHLKEPDEADIVEEVRGRGLELILEYQSPPAQVEGYVSQLSPSFIMESHFEPNNMMVDRTWPYRGLDDDIYS